MKNILLLILTLIPATFFAQKQCNFYYQIPEIPGDLACDEKEPNINTFNEIENLIHDIEVEKVKIKSDIETLYSGLAESYNLADFSLSDEDIERLSNMSEEEQEAFGAKTDAEISRHIADIENKDLLYSNEKSELNKKTQDYFNDVSEITILIDEKLAEERKIKKQKNDAVKETCKDQQGRLTEQGARKIAENKIDFCNTVSPLILKKLNYQYDNLAELINNNLRLATIDLIISYNLTEKQIDSTYYPILLDIQYDLIKSFLTEYQNAIADYTPDSIENK